MQEITIFYSWQSDLDDVTNRKAIRDAIHLSIPDIEDRGVKIFLDEATRDEPGSPNIPATIIEKIKNSDIFIGDLTTINNFCACKSRKTPNPNVVFELGFAVSVLGWPRIIMLINTDFTDMSHLPFDFDRHRATKFKIDTQDTSTIKGSKKSLSKMLENCIASIIDKDPIKEFEKVKLSPEEIKKNRDLTNIKWIMSTIHQPSLQDHVETGPRRLDERVFHFWESFNGVFLNNLFHLYDSELYAKFEALHKALNTSVSFGQYYRGAHNPDVFVFSNLGDSPLSESQEKAWQAIDASLADLDSALKDINQIIRERYLEIDIEKLNKEAWRAFIDFRKEFIEKLEKEAT